MLSENIKKLVEYGVQAGLVPECERIYTTNLLLEMFCEDSYEDIEIDGEDIELEDVLKNLLDEAVSRGIIEDSIVYRDLFDTRLMNCLMPRPSQVQKSFWEKYEKSPKEATEYFYKLSQDSDYIRRYRVKKDMKWKVDSPYGEIDITVNLSKPEKDPKAIAAAKNAKVRGAREPSRKRKSPDHSHHGQRQQMGLSVFALCVLQRALYRVQRAAHADEDREGSVCQAV